MSLLFIFSWHQAIRLAGIRKSNKKSIEFFACLAICSGFLMEMDIKWINGKVNINFTLFEIRDAWVRVQESISSTFYTRIFRTQFWRQKISNSKHSNVIFGGKILYEKRAHKTLMKLIANVSKFSFLKCWLFVGTIQVTRLH